MRIVVGMVAPKILAPADYDILSEAGFDVLDICDRTAAMTANIVECIIVYDYFNSPLINTADLDTRVWSMALEACQIPYMQPELVQWIP